ncbi:MAG: carboxypeptidase regulatory-like domain-containing protein [Gemmatimonadetes bacterium]|nr:carboxypeptidase regulatory-like domain-containing protein [Gemmatimonadota bacterium]
MATRLDRTTSAADGHFHLRDLPPGNYTLRAALPALGSRYGAMRVKLVVGADGSAGTGVSLSLPPTLVRGRVLGRGDEPVALAEVRLRGSGEKTFTDRDGRFVLAGVETGERTVEVSARGYPAARQTVRLPQPGWERTLEFRLAGDTP